MVFKYVCRVNWSPLSLKKICRDTLFLKLLERSPRRVEHASSTAYLEMISILCYLGYYSQIFMLFRAPTTTWSLGHKRRLVLDLFFKTLLLRLKSCQMVGCIFSKKFHVISIRKQKVRRHFVNHWVFVRGPKRYQKLYYLVPPWELFWAFWSQKKWTSLDVGAQP